MAKALATSKEIASRKTAKLELVLEYIDGPQAVLLQKSDNSRIVAVASDHEGMTFPFFGAEISLNQWEKYRCGFVDFRYLFMFPHWKNWYVFDLADDQDKIRLTKTEKDEHSEQNYVPDHGFFSYDHSEPINIDIKKGRATQKYKTDGNWDLGDFTTFYHKFSDLYAFFLSLKLFEQSSVSPDKKKAIKDAFTDQPLRGGSSYMQLYKLLGSNQEFDDRLVIGKLRYASPGEIEVKGRFDIFGEISNSYERVSADYDLIKAKYAELHKYLHERNLLRAEAERFDNQSAQARDLLRRANVFAGCIDIPEPLKIYNLTDNNPLLYAKILLAHFRRIERYFLFFAEGRVKDPQTEKPN